MHTFHLEITADNYQLAGYSRLYLMANQPPSNGECIVCPYGIDSSTNKCLTSCKQNEQLIANKCVCKSGYGYDKNNNCIDCSTIAGGF